MKHSYLFLPTYLVQQTVAISVVKMPHFSQESALAFFKPCCQIMRFSKQTIISLRLITKFYAHHNREREKNPKKLQLSHFYFLYWVSLRVCWYILLPEGQCDIIYTFKSVLSRLPLKIRKGVLLSDFLIDQNLWWMNLESSEIQLTPNSFPSRDLSETFLYPAIFQPHQSTETTPNCRVISLKGEV